MRTRTITKAKAVNRNYVWDAYVNILAMESYNDLAAVQRPAHLVFWYEHEIQNGGHLQYFENHGTERVAETIQALGTLGATAQQEILQEAFTLWTSTGRQRSATIEQFCEAALEGDFSALDRRIYACSPELPHYLRAYLDRHESSFVLIQ